MVLEMHKIMGTGGRSSLLPLWSLGIVGYILGDEATGTIFPENNKPKQKKSKTAQIIDKQHKLKSKLIYQP